MTARRELLLPLFAVAYLLVFAGDGLFVYLSGDDFMNLHGYWLTPWDELLKANLLFFSGYYRPLGGLYYRVVYGLFGLEASVFRGACFFLLSANIFLTFLVVRKLTRSRWQAAIAALLIAYHGQMADLYYNGGTIYELLCYGFILSAMLIYLQPGKVSGWRAWAIPGLFIAALNSKEMAAVLPVTLVLFEALLARPKGEPLPQSLEQFRQRYLTLAVVGAIAVVYVLGKLSVANPLLENPGYSPDFSLAAYFAASAHYLGILFYHPHSFTTWMTAGLWGVMAAAALVLRSRVMMFALLYILVSVGPVAFVPLRSGFVYYLPAFGWALYLAAAAETVAKVSFPASQRSGVIAFAAVALFITPVHYLERDSFRQVLLSGITEIEETALQLEPRTGDLRHGRSLLLLDDPSRDWWPYYLLRLSHGDPTIAVQRVQRQKGQSLDADPEDFDGVIRYRETSLTVEMHPHRPGPVVAISLTPAVIQPGESYIIEIAEMPGETIDIAYVGGVGFFRTAGVATAFCTLDERGRATIPTPPDQTLGAVAITQVRPSRGHWRSARGGLVVATR